MNEYDDYRWKQLLIVLILTGTILILFSCKSGCNITEATALHDTMYVYSYERDSIYLHDSIYHEVTLKGDTVIITNDKWHTAYRDRLIRDTLYKVTYDTTVVTMSPIEIENKPTWWEIFEEFIFYSIIALIVLLLAKRFRHV